MFNLRVVLHLQIILSCGAPIAHSFSFQDNSSWTNNVKDETGISGSVGHEHEAGRSVMRILALFTGSSNDLGLDHRLGRQVLKLATTRARRLNPEFSDIQLAVINDSTECKGSTGIPGRVAEQFYKNQIKMECGQFERNASVESASCPLGATTSMALPEPSTDSRIDAILGPSCDQLIDSIARMAAYWRIPIYTVTSINGAFGQKDIYPTLTRLSPSIDHLGMFFMKVMERFKWRHLAIVIDQSQSENMAILANLDRTIDRMRYSIPIERKIFPFSSFTQTNNETKGVPSDSVTSDLATSGLCTRESLELLMNIRKVARVVLLLLNEPQIIRRLLLCAHELRFNNGEYTFLALNLGLKSGASSRSLSRKANGGGAKQGGFDWFLEDEEENNTRARQMFESLMVFSVELPISNEYNIFVEQTLDMAHQEYPGERFEHANVGPLALALHDSLLLAVEAQKRYYFTSDISKSNKIRVGSKHESRVGETIEFSDDLEGQNDFKSVPLMWNEHYSDGLIPNMHINSNGDQELDYVLSDMEPELGVLRPVASYSKETRQMQLMPGAYIHWPARLNAATRQMQYDDEPPLDEPECGFTGEAERCVDRQNLFMVLGILSFFTLVLTIIAFMSFRRYKKIKYQMQLDDYWWKINWSDLEFLRAQRNSLTSNLASSFMRKMQSQGAGGTVGGHQSVVGSHISDASNKHKQAGGRFGYKSKRVPGDSGETPQVDNKRRSAVSLVVTPASIERAQDSNTEQSGHEENKDQDSTSHAGSQTKHGPGSLGGRSSLMDRQSSRIIHSELSTVVRHSSLAIYKGEVVIVKQLNGKSIEVTRNLLIELKTMRELSNENLARLIGLCIEPDYLAVVYEYCSRGNLQNLLLNTSISMDWNLKYSIIGDIMNGLNFIHTTLLDYHGRLKSTNLVLDSRFTVKLTDFGLRSLYNQLDLIETNDNDEKDEEGAESQVGTRSIHAGHHNNQQSSPGDDPLRRQSMAQTIYNMDSVSMRAENFGGGHQNSPNLLGSPSTEVHTNAKLRFKNKGSARFFWTAPEHLRSRQPHLAGSKRGDVYSVGVILYEIFTRREPFYFGTNAKPLWKVIKRDKLRHQKEQERDQMQRLQPHQSIDEQVIGHDEHSASRVLANRQLDQAKRSHVGANSATRSSGVKQSIIGRNRKRRSQASVGPLSTTAHQKNQDYTKSSDRAETESSYSQASSGGEQSTVGAGEQPVKINVSTFATATGGDPTTNTIGEEEEDGEASVVSQRHSASGRRTSSNSCQLQETKGGHAMSSTSLGRPKVLDSHGGEQTTAGVLDAEEILDQLRMGIEPEPIRPYIPNYVLQGIDPRMVELLRSCWHEQPAARPTIGHVRTSLRKITKGATAKNYLDNLLDRLQTYASQLERIVDAKSSDIMTEKARTEELLYQLVPRFVADKLKRSEPIIPQVFDGVTIFFSDIVGFEKYASVMSPCELVDLLNNIYCSFESIISSFDVTKIEVILDQYLVASGISLQQQQQQQQPTETGQGDYAAKVAESSGQERQPAISSQAPKSKRRLLGALRGSQSIPEDKSVGGGAGEQNQAVNSSNQEQAGQGAGPDLDHYRRSSAEQIARMALCIRDLVKSFHFRQNLNSIQKPQAPTVDGNEDAGQGPHGEDTSSGGVRSFVAATFNIRIGIHSGKVCAGIVGLKRPKFCLIGDTVNVASRMHTNSKANRIQISSDTRELLKLVPGLTIEPRGSIEIKGKGMMDTYWLESSY